LSVIFGTGVVQEVVVTEINAIFEEGAGLVVLNFVNNFVCLLCEEESNDVVLDRVADLLFIGITHRFGLIIYYTTSKLMLYHP